MDLLSQYQAGVRNNLLKGFVLQSESKGEANFKTGIAIIFKGDQVLLGRSRSKDFRSGKYCFPGGQLDKGENPYQAAVREAKEEADIVCIPEADPILVDEDNNELAFVFCRYVSGNPKPNWEFEDMQWFYIDDLPEDILEQNLKILEQHG